MAEISSLPKSIKCILLLVSFSAILTAYYILHTYSEYIVSIHQLCIHCLATYNYSEFNTSDVGIFHTRKIKQFPKYHPPGQKWVMNILEPSIPPHERWYGPNYTTLNGKFNATWTYSVSSDINFNYSTYIFVKRKTPMKVKLRNFAANRARLIVWLVSNCNAPSGRFQYVRRLQKYVPVDIYGGCGKLKCKNLGECYKIMGKNYKFYLSFENSLCVDYATEKIERPYNLEVVPIVLGAFNYSAFLPPHSYFKLDVKDFRTPKHLIDLLKVLDKNDTMYNSYFEWKKHYKTRPLPREHCRLCEYLNKSYNKTKMYQRMDQFWSETDCFKPENFYTKLYIISHGQRMFFTVTITVI